MQPCRAGRASETAPNLPGAAASFLGPADCNDGRTHGRVRDSATVGAAPRHLFGQASDSSLIARRALESVPASALATCLEPAIFDASAPGLSECYFLWF